MQLTSVPSAPSDAKGPSLVGTGTAIADELRCIVSASQSQWCPFTDRTKPRSLTHDITWTAPLRHVKPCRPRVCCADGHAADEHGYGHGYESHAADADANGQFRQSACDPERHAPSKPGADARGSKLHEHGRHAWILVVSGRSPSSSSSLLV